MNEPVDPVTPEVACSSSNAVPDTQSPSMSDMVENFIQLAQSLQKRGLGSAMAPGMSEPGMSELQSQLRKHSSHSTEVYGRLHEQRRSPQRSKTAHIPAMPDLMHTPQQPGALASDATREEARQLLHTLLTQATGELQSNLSYKSGRLKSTRSPKKPSWDQKSSPDFLQHRKPRIDASSTETGIARAQQDTDQWVMPAALHSHPVAGDPSHPAQNAERHPLDAPMLAVLCTPFSPVPNQSVTSCPSTRNLSKRSPEQPRTHRHDPQMMDVTRTSIAKDKDRRLGASALTQHVHVDQGRQYLGASTWDSSPQRRPANVDLLHGYRSPSGKPGDGHSSCTSMLPAKWVPGGRNKQTFNKFAAEQAHISRGSQCSRGSSVLTRILLTRISVLQKTSTGCFSAGTAPLLSASPAKTHDKRFFSAEIASPRAARLPPAADALRGQPRCHRAFVSPSRAMGSFARPSLPPQDSAGRAYHLDLTCPQDRLKFDAHVARKEGHTTTHHPWDSTCRSLPTSPTSPTLSTTRTAHVVRSPVSSKLSGTSQGKAHGSTAAGAGSRGPGRWDPCSSLDASQLQHLRSRSEGGSLSASGLVEFHSPSCEHPDSSTQLRISNSLDGTEATPSSSFNQTDVHGLSFLEQVHTVVSSPDDASVDTPPQGMAGSDACIGQEMHQLQGGADDQTASSEALTAFESAQVAVTTETRLCTGQVHREDHHDADPRPSPELARNSHSVAPTPDHQEQNSESQGHLPATALQPSDTGGLQQNLDRAYALIDFVSLSVEELQRQLHCACHGHMCSDAGGVGQMPLLHEHASGVASQALHPSDTMHWNSVPGMGSQLLEAGPDISAQKSAIFSQLGDIRESMQQLHTAHLHAMDESARSTLAVRTGRLGTMAETFEH